jgi:hypothetical protein
MVAQFGIEALKQVELPFVVKGITAIPTDFGNGVQGNDVFNGDVPGCFQGVHGGTGKTADLEAAHPAVFTVFKTDGVPTVVFILGIVRIDGRGQVKVFHSATADASGPG